MNTVNGTVRPTHNARRTTRRSALDKAYDIALADIPPEIRPLLAAYAENMRQGQEIRSALSNAMARSGGVKWLTVDAAARELAFG